MDAEAGGTLISIILALTAIIKNIINQNTSKKNSDSLETEVKLLRDRVNRLDKLDEKFTQIQITLTELKTQLGILLQSKGIKTGNDS